MVRAKNETTTKELCQIGRRFLEKHSAQGDKRMVCIISTGRVVSRVAKLHVAICQKKFWSHIPSHALWATNWPQVQCTGSWLSGTPGGHVLKVEARSQKWVSALRVTINVQCNAPRWVGLEAVTWLKVETRRFT